MPAKNQYMEEPVPFEPEAVVKQYRDVSNRLREEESEIGRMEFTTIAQRLRVQRKERQGEDCLHEMAFGEPWG